MTFRNFFKWLLGSIFLLLVIIALLITVIGWNWLRGPIERAALAKTGRALAINGDLTIKLAWPLPILRAEKVTFANPPWAKQAQMASTDAVQITLNLPQLLRKQITIPEVSLENPVVSL